MIEFDDFGEMALVPLAALAVAMAWRWRPALPPGVGGGRIPAMGGLPAQAGAALRRALDAVWGRAVRSGNQAFDAHHVEALRKVTEERREFRAFVERSGQARDRSEFDAFMSERGK